MNIRITTNSDRPHFAIAEVYDFAGNVLDSREFTVKNPAHEYRYGNQAYAQAYEWAKKRSKRSH